VQFKDTVANRDMPKGLKKWVNVANPNVRVVESATGEVPNADLSSIVASHQRR